MKGITITSQYPARDLLSLSRDTGNAAGSHIRRTIAITCMICMYALTFPGPVLGQIEMMNRYASIDSTWEYAPVAARPTQEDSTIFVWLRGTGDSTTIYAQKVDNASGLPQWLPYDGVPVCTVLGHKRNPVAVYDTMGGVIIGWEDYRHRIGAPLDADSTSSEIYAQRLFTHDGGQDANWNPAGQLSIGTPVCSGTNAPARDLRMVGTPDGAYFTWTDYRNSSGYPNFNNKDVYVQYLLSGTAAAPTGGSWVQNGIRATRQSQDEQQHPDICLDFVRDSRTSRYGVYVVYESDSSSAYYIKANNVRSGGTFNPAFDLGHVDINLSTSGNAVTHPRIASTGTYTLGSAPYGAFACWEQMDSDLDIIGEGFDEQAAPFWGTVAVCTASEIQAFPRVAAYSDQAVIAWEDHRNSSADTYALDVYANVIDLTTGNPEATPSTALTMSAAAYEQKAPDVDFGFGQDEMYVCWEEHRDSLSTGADIYAQGIDCLYPTQLRWSPGGRRVSAFRGDQVLPHIAGEVVVWQDGRRSGIMGDGREDTDIFCELFGDECDYVTDMHWRDVYAKHTRGNDAEHPRMAVDSAGNRFMIWDEERGSSGGKAVWIQKFDRWGVPRWANNGIMLSDDEAYAVEADVCTDGAGGAYAVWLEDNSDVKLTRVYSNGSVLQTVDVSSSGAEPKVVEDRTLTTVSGCIVAYIDGGTQVSVLSYSPAIQMVDYHDFFSNITNPHHLKISTTYENGVWAAISDGGNPDFMVGFWDAANGNPKDFQPIAQIESSEFDIVTDQFPYTNSNFKDPNTQLYDLLVAAVDSKNNANILKVFRVATDGSIPIQLGEETIANSTSYTNWDGACSPSIAIDSIAICGDEGPEVGGALVAWANRYIHTVTHATYYQIQTNRVVWDCDMSHGYQWSRDIQAYPHMAPILDSAIAFQPATDIAMMLNGFDENELEHRFGLVVWETDRQLGCSPSVRALAAQRVNYTMDNDPPTTQPLIWGSYGTELSPGIGGYQQSEPIALTPEIGARSPGVPTVWLDARSGSQCLVGTSVFELSNDIAWEKAVSEPVTKTIPIDLELRPVYPNPVPPGATCAVTLRASGAQRTVQLGLYDMLGRERLRIFDRPVGAESITVRFSPSAAGLAAGMYRLVLHDGERVVSRSLLLLN